MADYPSIEFTTNTRVRLQDGRQFERTDDGTARVRVTYAAEKRSWSVEHLVDDTDAATLITHYENHLEASFNFTDPKTDVTYAVVYGSAPDKTHPSHSLNRIVTTLQEV